MNGFDYILLFFDRIYQSSHRFALARRIYWIFYNWHKAATNFWCRNLIKKIKCKIFSLPKVDWVSSISSLRAIGLIGRWPEIDEDK